MSRHEDFYSEAKSHAKAIWDALSELEALQKEHAALDYGTTLPDADPAGANAGLTKVEVGAVVFATADAIRGLFNTGHATNVAKLL